MGYPDGMAIDVEDKLWIALWDGCCVGRFDPETGKVLGKVEVPTSHVSACAFGGPSLDELFITTARHLMKEDELRNEPHAGSLFHAHVGVRGRTFPAYGG
jgi:sugar lactone lactonase YvrE